MKQFLPEATSFVNLEMKERQSWMLEADWCVCLRCKGYGSWNLKLDTYSNKRHFNAICGQCHGWGFVQANSTDATCVPHDFRRTMNLERCYNRYTCQKCGKTEDIDSSD